MPFRRCSHGKRVVVVDDSLVRGTTSRKIVKMIRQAGAKEVHVRISSPPIISPCFYGIDTPTKKELIASSHSTEEIRKYITADSLAYLSLDGHAEIRPRRSRSVLQRLFHRAVSHFLHTGRRIPARTVRTIELGLRSRLPLVSFIRLFPIARPVRPAAPRSPAAVAPSKKLHGRIARMLELIKTVRIHTDHCTFPKNGGLHETSCRHTWRRSGPCAVRSPPAWRRDSSKSARKHPRLR